MSPGPTRPLVVHLLPDLAVGGGQVVVQAIAASAVTVDHVVWTRRGGPMLDRYTASGVEVRVSPSPSPVAGLRDLDGLVAERRPDVLHVHHSPSERLLAAVVGRRHGVPILDHLHAIATSDGPRREGEGGRYLLRRGANLGSRLLARVGDVTHVAVSGAVRDAHARALRLDPDEVQVILPGVDTDRFRPVDGATRRRTRDELGVGDGLLVITIGRVEPNKGQRDVVTAVASAIRDGVDLDALVVGEGPDAEEIARVADRLDVGDRVHLLGRRDDLDRLLPACDVLVSASRFEGFGLTLVEALASGVAVVSYASDTLAAPEILEGGRSGTLVPAGDVVALGEALVHLAAPAAREPIIERGRARAQDLSTAATSARLERLYRAVIDRR